MAENAAEPNPKTQVRHDWYQTETHVAITVLVKNVKESDLKVNFNETNIQLNIEVVDSEPIDITFNLSHKITPDQCSYKITPSKIELKLKKLEGIRWEKLEGKIVEEVVKTIPQASVAEASGPPSYPTSKKGKDWTAIEKDIKKQEDQEKPEGEEALNKLFQQIYGKGSDEVKKAMNKSYLESGGTVLSTNWNEISKDKVKVQPPDGMEWKKWN